MNYHPFLPKIYSTLLSFPKKVRGKPWCAVVVVVVVLVQFSGVLWAVRKKEKSFFQQAVLYLWDHNVWVEDVKSRQKENYSAQYCPNKRMGWYDEQQEGNQMEL